jgi:tRNA dimethylallyltransferase
MSSEKKYLIAILGPTASGKTALSIELAKKLQTEILSFDSRQFFREMNIGTAKVTEEEMQAVPHHFISHISVEEEYSAGDFEREALTFLEDFFQTHNLIIAVGGSGLYLDALEKGLDPFPPISESANKTVAALEEAGLEAMQSKLKELDPAYFEEVDQQNPARLRRALLVCLSSGKPYSAFLNHSPAERNFEVIRIGLDVDREKLYERINHRVDQMVEQGLIEEAKRLYPRKALKSLQTVGYQELFNHWDGKINLEEAIDKIKQHSRNYAKRQMTWFRRDSHIRWFAPDAIESIMAYLSERISGIEEHL